MTVPTIEATPHRRRREVLQLLQLDSARTEGFLAAAQGGEIDMRGLFQARRGNAFVGAVWGQVIPGRAAFLWPATLVTGEPEKTAERLQAAVDQFLDAAGVALTQAVLPPRDVVSAERLTRAGYRHLAELKYLVSARDCFPAEQPASKLSYLPCQRVEPARIKALIDRTYVDTLDCTELDRARSIDDVVIGYQRTGVYRPEWWILAQHQGNDVGCVLLADHPEHDQCELMYLGVVPEARGRQWGFQLTQHAQWITNCAGRSRVVLAVDDANWPAQRLYQRAGFQVWDQRSVYVRTARSDSNDSPSECPHPTT